MASLASLKSVNVFSFKSTTMLDLDEILKLYLFQ